MEGQVQTKAEEQAPASPKRGENPRQQMQKANALSCRQCSAEEKIRIVLEGIRGIFPCRSCVGERGYTLRFTTNG